MRRIRGNNTPAVVVVVYGNRDYEDALLELRDVVAELGFRPIAGGAFIGEHSYSSGTIPIAVERPDRQDTETAKRFGESVFESLSATLNVSEFQLNRQDLRHLKERAYVRGISADRAVPNADG